MVTHCKQPETMVNWEKMYGNAWSNMLKLWWRVALWPIRRVWKIALSFSELNLSHAERVTTRFKTQETWIGHNTTSYHNLNALLHVLPHIFFSF